MFYLCCELLSVDGVFGAPWSSPCPSARGSATARTRRRPSGRPSKLHKQMVKQYFKSLKTIYKFKTVIAYSHQNPLTRSGGVGVELPRGARVLQTAQCIFYVGPDQRRLRQLLVLGRLRRHDVDGRLAAAQRRHRPLFMPLRRAYTKTCK
jgi:hypothetical protein